MSEASTDQSTGAEHRAMIKKTMREGAEAESEALQICNVLREAERAERDMSVAEQQIASLLAPHPGDNNKRSRLRRLLAAFVAHDTSAIMNHKRASGRGFVALDSFIKRAATHHMVVRNWPAELPFPGMSNQITYHKLNVPQLQEIIGSRVEFLEHVLNGTATQEEREEKNFFRVEQWDQGVAFFDFGT